MITDRDVATFFQEGYRRYLPHLSVDCVVFGFHEGTLKVLLLKWKHSSTWTLPGGFVGRREALDAAAARVLRDRTGLRRVYLQQFHAFGGTRRRERQLRALVAKLGVAMPADAWAAGRVVSIGYYALVNAANVRPKLDVLSDACEWWPVNERPRLAFDHDAIVTTALESLRVSLQSRPVGSNLLPPRFTMPELQRLYESILGTPLDRRNFQKRILELGIVERLDERRTGGAHRSPYLYRFDRRRYAQALSTRARRFGGR